MSTHPTYATLWHARWHNQFTRPIGEGAGATREEAVAAATESANRTLAEANRAWKWRKQKLTVEPPKPYPPYTHDHH